MKLSEKEMLVLAAARMNADQEIPALAKATGLKPTNVRYILKSLVERNYITRFALINRSLLGYVEYDISCQLSLQGHKDRKRFFDTLKASPAVKLILESGGSYHCVFSISARNPSYVDAFLKALADRFGSIFIDINIAVCLGHTLYPPKYLPCKVPAQRPLTMRYSYSDERLDDTDKQVLQTLAEFPDRSWRDLAVALKLPPSTLMYRVQALRKAGLFCGHLWAIHTRRFGHQQFRVHVSLRGVSPATEEKMSKFCNQHPNVIYLVQWLGSWQYAIGLTVPHSDHAASFVNELYDELGLVLNRTVLFPVVKEHKVGSRLFAPEPS